MSAERTRPMKVMIVGQGDEMDAVAHCLQADHGMDVVQVVDDAEVLERIAREVPVAILFDCDGCPEAALQRLYEVRQRFGSLPIIALGSAGDLRMVTDYIRHGATEYLPKPLHRELAGRSVAALATRPNQPDGGESRTEVESSLDVSSRLETLGLLTGAVAHDLNNLMTVLLGYSDLVIKQCGANGPILEHMAEIRKAAERASGLSMQLLSFSREQEATPKPINLNSIIQGMEGMIRRVVGENVQLELDLAASRATILAEALQIEQVLLNLVLNARDAMARGGLLTIATSEIPAYESNTSNPASSRPYVRVVIRDTGTGMDLLTQSRIFEPFFTTKGPGKGTGLGLAIIRKIVDKIGGVIQVASIEGEGTSFTINFPLSLSEPCETMGAARPPSGYLRGAETILVVEDSTEVRTMLAEFLSRLGYRVLTAATGQEAVERSENHSGKIDVLITDVALPLIDGPILAAFLQKSRPDMRVLYMSGHNPAALATRGLTDTSVPFIQKPFAGDALAQYVRRLLDVSAA